MRVLYLALTVAFGLVTSLSHGNAGEGVDFDGNQIKSLGNSARIASLSPATTEILFEIDAGGQVVGRTDGCNYPKAAVAIESVGSLFPPNLEAIIRLKPDVVVMTSGSLELKERLRQLGIYVVVSHSKSLRDIGNQIRQLGRLTGRERRAEAKALAFESAISAIERRRDGMTPKVYWEIWTSPLMTAGKTSFLHDLVHAAGGKNIFQDQKEAWPKVTAEAVIRRRPDFIFTIDRKGLLAQRSEWPALLGIPATRIIQIENPDILHRTTPRLVNGLKWVAEKLREER